MDMNVNIDLIKQARISRNWTQQHLADICDVSLRTVQRVEKTGIASKETVASMSSAFEINSENFVINTKNDSKSESGHKDKNNKRGLIIGLICIMISHAVGYYGIYHSVSFLTNFQFKAAVLSVSCAAVISYIMLGIGAYKKGIFNTRQDSY